MKKGLIIFTMFFTLLSCEVGKSVDSPELREEVENRKIKQIHEPEILARALKIGSEVVKSLNSKLELKQDSLQDSSASLCYADMGKVISMSAKEYKVAIKKICLPITDLSKQSKTEAQLLDAYLYNEENNIESNENIQKVGEQYIYVYPIFVTDLCPSCNDNKLIGMWSVSLEKKMVVLTISDDTWKNKKLRNPRTK